MSNHANCPWARRSEVQRQPPSRADDEVDVGRKVEDQVRQRSALTASGSACTSSRAALPPRSVRQIAQQRGDRFCGSKPLRRFSANRAKACFPSAV